MDEAARAQIRRNAEGWTERAVAELVGPLTTALTLAATGDGLRRYSLIVGDDTSARIPARMVWRVVNRARAAGTEPKPKAAFWFLPGGGGQELCTGLAARVLETRAPGLIEAAGKGRALIVTDAVEHGGSVALMASGLRAIGIPCDVLTAVREHVEWERFHHPLPEGVAFFVGLDSRKQLRVDGDHSISGVAKVPRPHARRSEHVTPYARAARLKADRAAAEIATALGY